MSDSSVRDAQRPQPDAVLSDMAAYALSDGPFSDEARETARLCLMDSLGCALAALEFPACTKLLGPVVPGAVMPGGARVPGTAYELDPVQAAFNIGTMIRWLDFNDTWLAAEWGHRSDNLGGILAVADYVSRRAVRANREPYVMRDVLDREVALGDAVVPEAGSYRASTRSAGWAKSAEVVRWRPRWTVRSRARRARSAASTSSGVAWATPAPP